MLVRSGDWAANAVVRARVRDAIRRKFGRETVEALLDVLPPAADVDLVQTFAELEADDGALSEVLFPRRRSKRPYTRPARCYSKAS